MRDLATSVLCAVRACDQPRHKTATLTIEDTYDIAFALCKTHVQHVTSRPDFDPINIDYARILAVRETEE